MDKKIIEERINSKKIRKLLKRYGASDVEIENFMDDLTPIIIDEIRKLIKKYGGTEEEVNEFMEDLIGNENKLVS